MTSTLHHAGGHPRDPAGPNRKVAGTAPGGAFLLSDESSFITAAEIPVDGGLTAHGGAVSVPDALRDGTEG